MSSSPTPSGSSTPGNYKRRGFVAALRAPPPPPPPPPPPSHPLPTIHLTDCCSGGIRSWCLVRKPALSWLCILLCTGVPDVSAGHSHKPARSPRGRWSSARSIGRCWPWTVVWCVQPASARFPGSSTRSSPDFPARWAGGAVGNSTLRVTHACTRAHNPVHTGSHAAPMLTLGTRWLVWRRWPCPRSGCRQSEVSLPSGAPRALHQYRGVDLEPAPQLRWGDHPVGGAVHPCPRIFLTPCGWIRCAVRVSVAVRVCV
jgi:hypothetical protein